MPEAAPARYDDTDDVVDLDKPMGSAASLFGGGNIDQTNSLSHQDDYAGLGVYNP